MLVLTSIFSIVLSNGVARNFSSEGVSILLFQGLGKLQQRKIDFLHNDPFFKVTLPLILPILDKTISIVLVKVHNSESKRSNKILFLLKDKKMALVMFLDQI